MVVKYTQEQIRKIKESNSLLEVVSEYVELERAGDKLWKGKCPFPERHEAGDEDPSFMVYENNNTFYCYGCGAGEREKNGNSVGSDVVAFICMKKKLSFPEALAYLSKRAGLPLPNSKPTIEQIHFERVLSQNRVYYSNLLKSPVALEYFASRGVTEEDIEKWRLGYVGTGVHPSVNNRVVFPIFNELGFAVGFGYRAMGDEQPKYRNSKESLIFHKGKELYGLNFAKQSIREVGEAYVTEGYMDVISAHRYGVSNTVGIMSTAFTIDQAKLLRKYTDTIIFALDGDEPGTNRTFKHVNVAKELGFIAKVVKMEKGMDLDDYAKTHKYGLHEWLKDNETFSYLWQIDVIMSKYRTELETLRLKHLKTAQEVIDQLEDPWEKAVCIDRISVELGVPLADVLGTESN